MAQDSIFEKITYSQWSATLESKVKASWNLHRFLPADMDFFILLSSLSGIYGAVGQGNYAAGCTFQDALARARTEAGCFGRCSVSLDLGWMRTIGVIAESELSAEYLRNRELSRDSAAVEAEDLMALLEHYCDPSLSPSEIRGSQLLVGAITPAYFLARGEDVVAATLAGNGHLFAGFDVPSAFANGSSSSNQPTRKEDSAAVLFQQAKDFQARRTVVIDAIKAKVARAMGVAIDDIDSTKKPSDYGVDSLMAVELRNWIHKSFGAAIAVFEMMGGMTITEVGELVASRAESSVTA
jgi:acyl carrier protein